MSGRRGPVALEMPWDVFTQRTDVTPVAPFDVITPPLPDNERVNAAARLVTQSRHPMIFVGAGAFDAADEILELAELIDAPVVAFRSGRGIVSNAHELGLTMAAAYRLWPQTDLMIGIGTRLELPTWRWPYRPAGQASVRIDIDPAEMIRFTPDAAIVADARAGTSALLAEVRRVGYKKTGGRREVIREATVAATKEIQSIQPQMAYLDVIRQVLPEDGYLVDEISQMGFTAWYGFPVYRPRSYVTAGHQGTLGSGFPSALGVKVAFPDKAVVSITGDGGFMFGVQELATAVQYGINLVTIVFNNSAYGNVRRDQIQGFDGRVIGSELVNPDFVKLAESFGVQGRRATTPDELKQALEAALSADAPALIEVPVERGSEASPWEFLAPKFG